MKPNQMRYLSLLLLVLLIACKVSEQKLTAQQIIDKTIQFSGADKVSSSEITFNFRDNLYAAVRKNGTFQLFRSYRKDTLLIEDVVTNNGYERLMNSQPVKVADSMVSRYSNSINSVHYFSVLPFGLNDAAVHKKLLKSASLKGKEYYKIEITFSKEGGGDDFDDVFIYWIGTDDFLVDYLAYSYHTNGGGKRFRVLKEQCIKNGIRFVDYHNYKPLNKYVSLVDMDQAFENKTLVKVSEIVLKDIEVTLLNE
jgi:hypothetical protein